MTDREMFLPSRRRRRLGIRAWVSLSCLLAVVVLIAILVKGFEPTKAENQSSVTPQADLELKDISVVEKNGQDVDWELKADLVKLLPGSEYTAFKNVKLVFHSGSSSFLRVTALRGRMNNVTRDLVLEGDVVVRSSEGAVMQTAVLRWNNGRRQLMTDAAVTILSPDKEVSGVGLISDIRLQKLVIKDRVRVIFYPASQVTEHKMFGFGRGDW